MKFNTITRFSFFFLLSTATAAFAQTTSGATGTTGAIRPSPATSAPRPPATNASVTADYKLVTGDKLRIEVYKDAQLSQSLQIRWAGTGPGGPTTAP